MTANRSAIVSMLRPRRMTYTAGRLARQKEHYKNKSKIKRGYYGRIIRQAGLLDQLRSRPTTHHSTSQVAPIMPMIFADQIMHRTPDPVRDQRARRAEAPRDGVRRPRAVGGLVHVVEFHDAQAGIPEREFLAAEAGLDGAQRPAAVAGGKVAAIARPAHPEILFQPIGGRSLRDGLRNQDQPPPVRQAPRQMRLRHRTPQPSRQTVPPRTGCGQEAAARGGPRELHFSAQCGAGRAAARRRFCTDFGRRRLIPPYRMPISGQYWDRAESPLIAAARCVPGRRPVTRGEANASGRGCIDAKHVRLACGKPPDAGGDPALDPGSRPADRSGRGLAPGRRRARLESRRGAAAAVHAQTLCRRQDHLHPGA